MSSFESAIKRLEEKLTVKVEKLTERVCDAVYECGLDCLSRSVPRAPIESGDLRNAGFVRTNGEQVARGLASGEIQATGGPPRAEEEVVAEVGYSWLPYLWKQHEDMSLRHDRTDGYKRTDGTTVNLVEGGQAKFLESVIVEQADDYVDYITQAAREGLET